MRYLALPLLTAAFVAAYLLSVSAAHAGTTFGFPKDSPAFTFELPDSMQAEYQADGSLVCTAKDAALLLKGVFIAMPAIKNERDLAIGFHGIMPIAGPKFITTDLRYFQTFSQDEPGGIHTTTAGAQGRHDGVDAALAFIAFPIKGKYYELIVSGSTAAMEKCSFPHQFRVTAKMTP